MLGKIFGSDSVVDKGLDLVDKMWTTDKEKTEVKIELVKAFEPFKLVQRIVVVWMLSVMSMVLILLTLFSYTGNTHMVDSVLKIADEFWIGESFFSIITFYFGGGLINSVSSVGSKVKERKEVKS